MATRRLTHKFPSNTSLWLILRTLESNIGMDNDPSRNFTARGAPKLDDGSTGAGRLYYETPVIQVMGRELASFVDLQKTLGQLGFNSGNILMRLSFRVTETPLEEAMQEIGQYFKSVEGAEAGRTHVGSKAERESTQDSSHLSPVVESNPRPEESAVRGDKTLPDAVSVSVNQGGTLPPVVNDPPVTGPDHRPISVYAAPSSSTPRASLQPFNEKDYEPTIIHARIHQSRLVATSRNQRLKNHSEEEAEIEAQKQKAASITQVEIKVRFPDQMQVVSKFSNLDTSTTLYDFVRGCLVNEDEPFLLNVTGPRGPQPIPKEGAVRLIAGLGMTGRVLVNFIWEVGASVEARVGKVLKDRFREKAKAIEVKDVVVGGDDDAEEKKRDQNHKPVPEGKSDSKGKGVPKWLKLPGKK